MRSELNDGRAYAGQQGVQFRLPATPTKLITTVTTGVIANAIGITIGQITGFATRFGSTFDEYRILGADVRIRPVTASTGVSVMFFDEKSTAVPTANEAQERTGKRIPNSNANEKSDTVMRWRAKDLLDLQYTAIGSSVTPVTFKVYTDTTTWGAPIAATDLWVIEPDYIVEFRGIKSS